MIKESLLPFLRLGGWLSHSERCLIAVHFEDAVEALENGGDKNSLSAEFFNSRLIGLKQSYRKIFPPKVQSPAFDMFVDDVAKDIIDHYGL